MQNRSKLKKAVVISAAGIFGLAGIGALSDNYKQNTTNYESSQAQSNNTSDATKAQQNINNSSQPSATEHESTSQPATVPQPQSQEETPPHAPAPNCDPNYSGGCVPVASDVDCGGGSGNGPAYFYGTATVVGSDIYGLDRDGDGVACE